MESYFTYFIEVDNCESELSGKRSWQNYPHGVRTMIGTIEKTPESTVATTGRRDSERVRRDGREM